MEFDHKVVPICLPQPNLDIEEKEVISTGWGITNHLMQEPADKLKFAILDTTTTENCCKLFEDDPIWTCSNNTMKSGINDKLLCAISSPHRPSAALCQEHVFKNYVHCHSWLMSKV